jgi:hypothetical protein
LLILFTQYIGNSTFTFSPRAILIAHGAFNVFDIFNILERMRPLHLDWTLHQLYSKRSNGRSLLVHHSIAKVEIRKVACEAFYTMLLLLPVLFELFFLDDHCEASSPRGVECQRIPFCVDVLHNRRSPRVFAFARC